MGHYLATRKANSMDITKKPRISDANSTSKVVRTFVFNCNICVVVVLTVIQTSKTLKEKKIILWNSFKLLEDQFSWNVDISLIHGGVKNISRISFSTK